MVEWNNANQPPMTEDQSNSITAEAPASKVIPLGEGKKTQIILNIEPSIKDLIDNICHKGESYTDKRKGDTTVEFAEKYETYPDDIVNSSYTGLIMHYVLKGIKEDMGIEFEPKPYALQARVNKTTSSGSGERFSKEKKNDILARCNASHYNDAMELEEIFDNVRKAMEEKKYWENEGYVLVPEKTKPPMKLDSEKYIDYLKTKHQFKADAVERGQALGSMAKEKASPKVA